MNKTDKKHHFNIIDVIIIIGVIAAVVFCARILTGSLSVNNTTDVHYCIKLEGVSANSINKISERYELYSGKNNIHIGTVKSISYDPMSITYFDRSTNRFVTENQDNIYDLYIYADTKCIFENGCYSVENLRISENTFIDVNIPIKYDRAEIVSVTAVNNKEKE